MAPTMYISLSLMQPRLARGEADFHRYSETECEWKKKIPNEERIRKERLEPKDLSLPEL